MAKGKKDKVTHKKKNELQNNTQETKDLVKRTPLKIEGELTL
jgi:hypothetical protein